MSVPKFGTENFTVCFDFDKQNKIKSSSVLSKQQAPAKSRKLCGQQWWLYILALFYSFRGKITRNQTLSGRGRASSYTAQRQTVAAVVTWHAHFIFKSTSDRGDIPIQCDVTQSPTTPQDRGFSKTLAVLAPFSDT